MLEWFWSPGAGLRRRGSLFLFALGAIALLAAAPGQASHSQEAMTQPDTLRVHLDAPDVVKVGEAVPVTVTVVNQSDGPLTLFLQGREIAFDITVSREDGTVVWRRLAGAALQAILRVEELGAGDSIVRRGTWAQQDAGGKPVPPGTYYLQGSVLTDGEPLATPRRLLRIQEAPE